MGGLMRRVNAVTVLTVRFATLASSRGRAAILWFAVATVLAAVAAQFTPSHEGVAADATCNTPPINYSNVFNAGGGPVMLSWDASPKCAPTEHAIHRREVDHEVTLVTEMESEPTEPGGDSQSRSESRNEVTLRDTSAPSNLEASYDSCGVNLTWSEPLSDAGQITGYRILRGATATTLTSLVADTGFTDTSYHDASAGRGETHAYAVQALRGATVSEQSNTIESSLPTRPTATEVTVDAVPIEVASTTDDYFVLYLKHQVSGADQEMPVAVVLGEASVTTLEEHVAALPKERYRVEKYDIANPADVDGDCVDDITELGDPVGMNPVNPTGRAFSIDIGAAAIPDRATFEALAVEFRGTWSTKFVIVGMNTDAPAVYFSNLTIPQGHRDILRTLGVASENAGLIRGELHYSSPGNTSAGLYRFVIRPGAEHIDTLDDLELVERVYALLAASMPVIDDDLAYVILYDFLPDLQPDLESYRASRVNLVFENELLAGAGFLPLNPGEGYGLLRRMDPDDRPGPRDVVVYESLPNDLPRVAGILSTVPQTPLSHVNLRAGQDNIPNAYIRDALSDPTISGLLDRYVYYKVTEEAWQMRAATIAEVNAHYEASRPAETQRLRRILSETSIQSLGDIGYDSCEAYGVKASNLAVLGTLGFPAGTVPQGYAIPFYFYEEFMQQPLGEETLFGKKSWPDSDKLTLGEDTRLIEAVEAILAHPKFQTDLDIQEEMLDDLRDAIKDAKSPQWIIDALTEMHDTYPDGQSLRYRSSTNNEDLPGFNGAGLYDSYTQNPDETEEDGIDKSLKQVYASLWNYRAFTERDFNRVDHRTVAMGVLVHPNFKDELVNGVAVSVDPNYGFAGSQYINSQVGEDLVTNPEEDSVPEEILLHDDGTYTVITTSNLLAAGELLMADAQLSQLRRHLDVIHTRFASLYNPAPDEPFAMEIEFKITSENILAIKQARPWIFSRPPAEIEGGSETGELTANWDDPPSTHSGRRFEVRLRFSTFTDTSITEFLENVFQVTGARVTRAVRLSTESAHWAVTFRPDGDGNVTITLLPNRPCTVRGAICTNDGVPLSNRLELVVEGPAGAEETSEPVERVRLACTGPNRAPEAKDDAVGAIPGEAITIDVLANDADPNSHALMLAGITSPDNGTVTATFDNRIVYVPNESFTGTDSFTYTATDGELFDTAAASVTVAPRQDPQFPAGPIIREVLLSAVAGDRVGAPVIATDVDSATLTYNISSAEFEIHPQTGQITVATNVSFDPSITPLYIVTVVATDEHGGRDSAQVTIIVVERLSRDVPIGTSGNTGGGGGAPAPVIPSEADFDWSVTHDIEQLAAEHEQPTGVWSDGTTIWILDNAATGADRAFAYNMESGDRLSEADLALDRRNRFSHGIWSDGEVVWIADSGQDRLFAYYLETGERLESARHRAGRATTSDPRGIWSNGATIYVLDAVKHSLFAYDLENWRVAGRVSAGQTEQESARHLVGRDNDLGLGRRRQAHFRIPTRGRRAAAGRGRGVQLSLAAQGRQRQPARHLVRRRHHVCRRRAGRQGLQLQHSRRHHRPAQLAQPHGPGVWDVHAQSSGLLGCRPAGVVDDDGHRPGDARTGNGGNRAR